MAINMFILYNIKKMTGRRQSIPNFWPFQLFMFPLVTHLDPQSRMVWGLSNLTSSLLMTTVNLCNLEFGLSRREPHTIWWHIWTPIQNINSSVDTLKTSSTCFKSVLFSNNSFVVMFCKPAPYSLQNLSVYTYKINLTKIFQIYLFKW